MNKLSTDIDWTGGMLSKENNSTKLYADLWGIAYQGKNSNNKKYDFITHNSFYKSKINPVILKALEEALPAFEGDSDTDVDKVREAAKQIAVHESDNGTYTKQLDGGPARGYWQVEPKTARDIIKTSGYLGTEALKVLGRSKSELRNMSDKELSNYLEDPKVSAVFGIAKLIQGAKSKGLIDQLK